MPGDKVRSFVGDGDRQYLTGLKVGGKRILFLVDGSASMLADTIVNAVRRRLLPEADRMRADKWRKAVRAVDWLTTQIPRDAQFQIYVFNTTARAPSCPARRARGWRPGTASRLGQAVATLRGTAPEGGTSLEAAFAAAAALRPPPDNILLLTDGLPTQGLTAPRGRHRLRRRPPQALRPRDARAPPRRARERPALPDGGRPHGRPRLLEAGHRHPGLLHDPVEGLAVRRRPRRDVEVFSLSFLDCICCGFGAIILLLTLVRMGEPRAIEQAREELKGRIARLERELFEIRGETTILSPRAGGRSASSSPWTAWRWRGCRATSRRCAGSSRPAASCRRCRTSWRAASCPRSSSSPRR